MSQVSIIDIEGNHPQIPTRFDANVGFAIPLANVLEIFGDIQAAGTTPVHTTGSGNTITTIVQVSQAIAGTNISNIGLSAFDSAYFTVDANGFVSFIGGSVAESFNVDASTPPGTDPVLPNGSGVVTVTGGQVAAGTTTNVIRTNSLAANTYTIEIQRSSAQAVSTVGANGVAHFNSAFFTVDSNGFVSVSGTGVAQTITGNSGGALSPTAGNWNIFGAAVAAGTTPVATAGAVSTLTVNIQRSQAIASTNATNVGLAAFNSSHFSVDANGFVSLIGGSLAVDSFAMQTGTSPVVPTVAGLVTFNGAVVAAGTNPVRTDGTGANTMAVEVQISQALAAGDATKIGLANFDSTSFAVSAAGFVTLIGTGVGKTITGDTGGALSPTGGNWNILGGPGVTTSGSGSTLTINSVVFTDTTATTFAVDNGYNATAAGTYNLPASAAQGELLEIFCDTTGAVVVDAPANNFIRIGSQITTSGGTATSNAQGDSLKLRYRLSTLTWEAISVVGTWTCA